jgi:hypothetical protein
MTDLPLLHDFSDSHAVVMATVRKALIERRAATKIMIMDRCFSGQARHQQTRI